eukprot:m.84039 g.84039  ORF g.84039 m.84039 type:complete len:448 (-) comp15003_c0_seq1:173-1516(-)
MASAGENSTPPQAAAEPASPLHEADAPLHEPVSFEDVSRAKYLISDGIVVTPCHKGHHLSKMCRMELYFKKEIFQRTGSFKERGARNALRRLTSVQRRIGVIAASAGNHALGLAYHGQLLGVPVTLVMPKFAPMTKVQNCREFGANVILHGAHFGEAKERAEEISVKDGLKYINGYDDPDVIAGQGTCGLEILEQIPDVDAIVVPAGGGGLLAGILLAVKTLRPDVQVIAVQAQNCQSFVRALEAGQPVRSDVSSTLADGLAVPVFGKNSFAICKNRVDKTVLVTETEIAVAILRLVELQKNIVEGAGAAGLAAVLAGKLPELEGKKVCCVLCGGNIDTTVLGRVIERGLAADGRLVRFMVSVLDRPGGLAGLTALIAQCGASVKDLFHERAWLETDVASVQVKCVVETRDRDHAEELRVALAAVYPLVWGSELAENKLCLTSKRPH